jgi:hypothetical protein
MGKFRKDFIKETAANFYDTENDKRKTTSKEEQGQSIGLQFEGEL